VYTLRFGAVRKMDGETGSEGGQRIKRECILMSWKDALGSDCQDQVYTHIEHIHIYITEELEGRLGNRLQERSRPPRAHGLST
jgi:hypothetical protein